MARIRLPFGGRVCREASSERAASQVGNFFVVGGPAVGKLQGFRRNRGEALGQFQLEAARGIPFSAGERPPSWHPPFLPIEKRPSPESFWSAAPITTVHSV